MIKLVLIFGLLVSGVFSEQVVMADVVGPEKPIKNYNYEMNTAPFALLVGWTSFDLVKYNFKELTQEQNDIEGYGISYVGFDKNKNTTESAFPNYRGYAFGLNYTKESDHKSYYAVHAFYEKYESYSFTSLQVQEREGYRINAVFGVLDILKDHFKIKLGWGVEASIHKVREFIETNRLVQNNYYTTLVNPLFIELKMGYDF